MNTRSIAAEYRLSHWMQVIQERKASGLSIREYCRASGLRENVYFYWQRKVRESACRELLTPEKPSAVVIQPSVDTLEAPNGWTLCTRSLKATPASNDPVLSIEIGCSRISVNADVDTELLAKVCRVLKSL